MGDVKIEHGSRVTLHYTLRLAQENRIADATRKDEPLTLMLGAGDMIEGLEKRLLGLCAGDRRRFEVPCLEAYGPVEEGAVRTLARADFPADMELEPGQVIGFEVPNGEEIPGTVVEVGLDEVLVDFSHPLAGHDLIFEVEIVDVESPR